MKLRNLKSVGHNAAHSYLSTLSHIEEEYTATVLYREALKAGMSKLELDVLNVTFSHLSRADDIRRSLQELQQKFLELLSKENIPSEAVKSYKLLLELKGSRMDVVDFQCKPVIIDLNNKVYECAIVSEKYIEPV